MCVELNGWHSSILGLTKQCLVIAFLLSLRLNGTLDQFTLEATIGYNLILCRRCDSHKSPWVRARAASARFYSILAQKYCYDLSVKYLKSVG